MSERPSLQEQIDALANNVASRRSYLRQVDELMNNPKHAERVKMESAYTRMWQPALEAGLETLRWVQAHEAEIRSFVQSQKGRAA